MFGRHSAAVYEMLREARPADAAKFDACYVEHTSSGQPFASLAVARGAIERNDLLRSVAQQHGCEFIGEMPAQFEGDALATIDGAIARKLTVMPWRWREGALELLIADPFDLTVADDLGFALDRPVRCFAADPEKVEQCIARHYGEAQPHFDEVIHELNASAFAAAEEEAREHDLEALATKAPIVKFVNLVLGQAIRDQASDVHFEPFEGEFKIRYRVDGALYEMSPPPAALALPIISRLKVLANLDIAERRVPQDGRMAIRVDERTVDLRVSTLPTQFGESVVLRVLDQSNTRLDLAELGMPAPVLAGVREIVRRPNGIFVVTGPTGSGKTTTLYSGLRAINSPDLKILTVEDPVEYEIDGIMQVAVNAATGLTFASTLRSFLRQDPDVIMVGEIRDLETAQIAIQASLTGHLVLTTLHTNDAAGAVTRLVDMGVQPFLIASTLEAVLAQRLVRRICPHCKTRQEPAAELLRDLGVAPEAGGGPTLYHGRGCDACNQSGYRGRLGIYEWLRVSETVREGITHCAPTHELRGAAIACGMTPLRTAGLRAAFDGVTTIAEVMRYT